MADPSLIRLEQANEMWGTTRRGVEPHYDELSFRLLPSGYRLFPSEYIGALVDQMPVETERWQPSGIRDVLSAFASTEEAHRIIDAAEAAHLGSLRSSLGTDRLVTAQSLTEALGIGRMTVTGWVQAGHLLSSAPELSKPSDSLILNVGRGAGLSIARWHRPDSYDRGRFVPQANVSDDVRVEFIEPIEARKGPESHRIRSVGRVMFRGCEFVVDHTPEITGDFGGPYSVDALALRAVGLGQEEVDGLLVGPGSRASARTSTLAKQTKLNLPGQVGEAFRVGAFIPLTTGAGLASVEGERNVLTLACAAAGMDVDATARHISEVYSTRITRNTIDNYRSGIFRRLGVSTVQVAVTLGFLSGQLFRSRLAMKMTDTP